MSENWIFCAGLRQLSDNWTFQNKHFLGIQNLDKFSFQTPTVYGNTLK